MHARAFDPTVHILSLMEETILEKVPIIHVEGGGGGEDVWESLPHF